MKKMSNLYNQAKVLAGLMLTSAPILATTTNNGVGFNKLSNNLAAQVIGFLQMASVFFYAAGIVLIGMGVFGIYSSQKQGSQVKVSTVAIQIVAGAGLVVLPYIVNVFASSITGDEQNTDVKLQSQGNNVDW